MFLHEMDFLFLKNEHYHHPDKGCHTKDIYLKREGKIVCNVICSTHKKVCSKTGWDIGWYLGRHSRTEWLNSDLKYTLTCKVCNKEFKTNRITQLICYDCSKFRKQGRHY